MNEKKKYEVWRSTKQINGVKNIEELIEYNDEHFLDGWEIEVLIATDNLEEARALYCKTAPKPATFDRWTINFAIIENIELIENNEDEIETIECKGIF